MLTRARTCVCVCWFVCLLINILWLWKSERWWRALCKAMSFRIEYIYCTSQNIIMRSPRYVVWNMDNINLYVDNFFREIVEYLQEDSKEGPHSQSVWDLKPLKPYTRLIHPGTAFTLLQDGVKCWSETLTGLHHNIIPYLFSLSHLCGCYGVYDKMFLTFFLTIYSTQAAITDHWSSFITMTSTILIWSD